LKKDIKGAGTMANENEYMVNHKCRKCNRTDRKVWNPSEPPKCNHCESSMDPLEIRYKCLRCGHLTWIEAGSTGKSCHKCGYRVFAKPRNQGRPIKTLKAI